MSRPGRVGLQQGQTPRVEWAGAILVNRRGELLLNLRDHSKALFPDLWDIVGGTLEPEETPEACLLREIAEETGVALERAEYLRAYDVPLDDGRRARLHVFLAQLDIPASELLLGEGVEHRFFSPAALQGVEIVPGTRLLLSEFVASEAYRRIAPGDGANERPHPNSLPGGEETADLGAPTGHQKSAMPAGDSPSPKSERGLGGEVTPPLRT